MLMEARGVIPEISFASLVAVRWLADGTGEAAEAEGIGKARLLPESR